MEDTFINSLFDMIQSSVIGLFIFFVIVGILNIIFNSKGKWNQLNI